MQLKWALMLLTFCATISQGIWIEPLKDEGLMIVDIPLILVYILGRKKLKQAPLAFFPLVLVVIFFIWSHIGIGFAVNKVYFWQELVQNIRVMLIFWAVISFINTKEDMQNLFLGLACGAIFQGLIGIHQWLRGPVGLGFLGEQFSGWQAQGTFVHPSVYGMYISLLTILNFRMAVFLRPKYHKIYVAAFFIGATALYASLNRATWLGFAISMTFIFLADSIRGAAFNKRTRGMLLFILLVATFGAVQYGSDIIDRFSDAEESMMADRSSSRMSLAKDAIRIIGEHPVVGTGLNNYREYVNDDTQGTQIVHCTYLLVGAELGIPGMVIFILLLLSFLFIGMKGTKIKDLYLRNVSTALITAIISFAVAILPSPDYRIIYVKIHIWMIFALILVVQKIHYHQDKVLKMAKPLAGSYQRKAKPIATGTVPHNGANNAQPGLREPNISQGGRYF